MAGISDYGKVPFKKTGLVNNEPLKKTRNEEDINKEVKVPTGTKKTVVYATSSKSNRISSNGGNDSSSTGSIYLDLEEMSGVSVAPASMSGIDGPQVSIATICKMKGITVCTNQSAARKEALNKWSLSFTESGTPQEQPGIAYYIKDNKLMLEKCTRLRNNGSYIPNQADVGDPKYSETIVDPNKL